MIKIGKNRKKKWKAAVPALFVLLSVGLNVGGWINASLCDFYVNHIFPVWVETYGRFTGLLASSFSLHYIAVSVFSLLQKIRKFLG